MFANVHIVLLITALCSTAVGQDAVQLAPKKQEIPFAGVLHLELTISDAGVHAFIGGLAAEFVGFVLLSDSPQQTNYLPGLPPILSNFVVFGSGYTRSGELHLGVPQPLPCLPKLYAQAVAIESGGLAVGGLVPIVAASCAR